MQYNAIQCNAMQYNAMQCNAMQCNVSESVRPYGMKSVSHFFFIFFSQFTYGVRQYVRNWYGWTDKFQLFFLVGMYECHGWTDKFQLFQFSFSSVAYSQVSLSVRTEVPTKKKKKEEKKHRTNKTQIDRRYIKRDRWHNSRQMPYY
jgi:hypothetical protein